MDYDDLAGTYDRRYADYSYDGIEDHLVRFARGAASVLEVGCGTGHWLEVLARVTSSMTGVDASAGMLAQARARMPHAALVHARAEALPFPDASFDRVLCVHALHHFDGKRAFVAEARRVLRSGGGLTICGLDPHTGHERWWIYDYYQGALARDRERYPSSAALCSLLAEVGFTRVRDDEVQRIASPHVAHEALAAGLLDQRSTSQLALLARSEYDAGIAQLRADIQAAARRRNARARDRPAYPRCDRLARLSAAISTKSRAMTGLTERHPTALAGSE
jgi:ubiquinone/menaquinone biosynthesis C-methylase UbiE